MSADEARKAEPTPSPEPPYLMTDEAANRAVTLFCATILLCFGIHGLFSFLVALASR